MLAGIFFAIFAQQWGQNGMVFTVMDFVIANFVIFMIVMGIVLYSRAIKYGKAGPV